MSLVNLELGQVAHLELNNPPMNLVTDALLAELDAALATLEDAAPGDVRVVVCQAAASGRSPPARTSRASSRTLGPLGGRISRAKKP